MMFYNKIRNSTTVKLKNVQCCLPFSVGENW